MFATVKFAFRSRFQLPLKDNQRKIASWNKTQTLTKSMNVDIWVVRTSNQGHIKASYWN